MHFWVEINFEVNALFQEKVYIYFCSVTFFSELLMVQFRNVVGVKTLLSKNVECRCTLDTSIKPRVFYNSL